MQLQNPEDRTSRPSFHVNSNFGSRPNDQHSGSTAGSRNRDFGHPGRRTDRALQQADGPRSTDSRNSSRGQQSPYSQNSSKSMSVVKPMFSPSRGSYEQVLESFLKVCVLVRGACEMFAFVFHPFWWCLSYNSWFFCLVWIHNFFCHEKALRHINFNINRLLLKYSSFNTNMVLFRYNNFNSIKMLLSC